MSRRKHTPKKNDAFSQELWNQFEVGLGRAILRGDSKNVEALRMMGLALSRAGRHQEALAVDRQLVNLLPEDPISFYNLACSYSMLCHVDDSIKTLAQALQLGYNDLSHMMHDDDLMNVREDQRFQKLVERKWGKRRARRKP